MTEKKAARTPHVRPAGKIPPDKLHETALKPVIWLVVGLPMAILGCVAWGVAFIHSRKQHKQIRREAAEGD